MQGICGMLLNWNARGHFWLAVTHAWLSRERQVTRESEIPKSQELAKQHKAWNLREREMQDTQAQLGSEERRAKNGEQGGRKCYFLYTAVPSTSPALHNHWLLLVTRPRPKAGGRVLNPPVFFFSFFFYITNRHSWDADWSQVGNLEMLIGSRALYSDHVLLGSLFSVELMAVRLLWFWLGRSVRSTSRWLR